MAFALVVFLSTVIPFHPYVQANGDVAQSPSLDPGTEFTWSYEFQNPQGDSHRSGTMNATVSEVQWRGYDCYRFHGLLTGTFTTSSGSGTETGTWYEYYRKIDLAFLDGGSDLDMMILTDKVTNVSQTSSSPPLTWIKFPLSYSDPRTIWGPVEVTLTETWEVMINDDDSTLESGSSFETKDHQYACINIDSLKPKSTDAGTFETYMIKEKIMDDSPRNKTVDYYYSEEVGWWVTKDVFEDYEGDQVRTKHYELTDWTVNLPPSVQFQPNLEMDEDVPDDSIDLDDIFSDPDGDPLSFAVVRSGPLSVEIWTGNILHIDPPTNGFGKWNVTISASDGIHPEVEVVIPVTIHPVDDPPALYDPLLDPDSGNDEDPFTFSIKLTDIDSGTPDFAEVRIGDLDHDLSVISGDNSTGMVLGWTGYLEPGDYSHYFVVDGVRHPASGTINGPEVRTSELPYLKEGGVDLSEGGLGTEFEFRVTWIGLNSEEPDEVYLFLDEESISVLGDNGDPETGIIYSRELYLEKGDHSFHFEASLDEMTFRYPENGEIEGPTVHSPEILDFGRIYLSESDGKAEYRFFVNYRYLADMEPEEVTVLLNGNTHNMNDDGGTPVSGINYTIEIWLFEGTYDVQFRVKADGTLITGDDEDLIVEIKEDEDGSDQQGEDGSGGGGYNTAIIIAFVMIIIVIAVAGFLLYSRRKRNSMEWKEEEEYEEEMDG